MGAVLALAAWSGGLFGPWAARLASESWFRLGGVCLTGGFATLLQLVRTPYLHYALLGLPFLVAGFWVVAVGLYRRLPALDRRPLAGLLALVVAAIPPARTESRRRFVELWPLHSAPYPAYDQPLPTMTLWRRGPPFPQAQITRPSGTTPSFGTTTMPSRAK